MMPTEKTSTASELSHIFATRIKKERERRAWTQAEVAERVGSTRINVSRWENGITTPGPYYRQKLAELFQKDVQELGLVPATTELSNEKSLSPSEQENRDAMPLWNIPHRRNLFFSGRKEILEQLYTKFDSSHSPLALTGLGGVGKTQIAIEYVYIYRDVYKAIFWINATTQETLTSDLFVIANRLGFVNIKDDKTIIQVIRHWLTTHDHWLLVLDNMETFEENMLAFLPQDNQGDVLLTTRIQVSSTLAHTIQVENMTLKEGIAFLLRRTRRLEAGTPLEQVNAEIQEQAIAIYNELGGLPLALDQAGAYIEEAPCNLVQYLQLYKNHSLALLQRRGKFPDHHPDPVATTWLMSFQHIKENWPASTELLHLCTFLDSDSIPEELLLKGAPKLGPILRNALENQLKLNDVLEPLHLYSLINRSPETNSLTIHRLVQAVLREDLSLITKEEWATRVILALNHTFPAAEQQNWDLCQQLLPQARFCLQLIEEHSLILPEAAQLFMRAGEYTYMRRMFEPSELFFKKVLAIYQELFPNANSDVAMGLNSLGELYRVWGRYKEAEALLQQALAIFEQLDSPNELDIAKTLTSLGELFHNLGRYDEAEPLFQRALSLAEKENGSNHQETYNILHHLARLYYSQGRYEKAERNYLQVLNVLEQNLSANHIKIATVLSNLAINYRKQGKLEQAEELLLRTLDIEEEAFGVEDHRYATTLHNLGVIYQKQGHYRQAETTLQYALSIKEASIGPNHPSSITTATHLANLYRTQRHYQDAIRLLNRALESGLNDNHPYRAVILRNLARVHDEISNSDMAQSLYDRAATQEKKPSS